MVCLQLGSTREMILTLVGRRVWRVRAVWTALLFKRWQIRERYLGAWRSTWTRSTEDNKEHFHPCVEVIRTHASKCRLVCLILAVFEDTCLKCFKASHCSSHGPNTKAGRHC